MTPAFTVAIRSASLSTPSVLRPRSAKLSARGRPTRPRPITETSYSKGCSVNSSSLTPGPGQTLGPAAILERGTAWPLPSVLPGERRYERRVVAKVAWEEPKWLLGEPERPLESSALDPGRRLALALGDEVERSSH